jgi:hypothetical protein
MKYALFVRTNEVRLWKYEGGTEDRKVAIARAQEAARVEGKENVRLFDVESGTRMIRPI